MNPDIKKLWVASLRDGSFPKGKFMLRDVDDRYDATGVLCELAVSAGVIGKPKKYEKPDATLFFGYTYEGLATGIPKAVGEWAGIEYRTAYSIALMGDKHSNFDKVADWIEKHL